MNTTKIDERSMLEDINKLVSNDWCAEMEMRYKMPNSKPISQKDAHDILDALLNVYMIAHQTSCTAHGKYRKKSTNSTQALQELKDELPERKEVANGSWYDAKSYNEALTEVMNIIDNKIKKGVDNGSSNTD